MEYISYILVILGILALILFWVFSSGQLQAGPAHSRPVTGKTAETPDTDKRSQPMTPQSLNIPTPWGWPGHEGAQPRKSGSLRTTHHGHGVPNSLHRFVDLMMSEKQTVENREYLLRKDASMRALLEDRFGRPSKPAEINYHKVKGPLLRDPSEPPDQLDSFNSNEADKVTSRLMKQQDHARTLHGQNAVRERANLGEVKTPWGW